MKLERMAKRFAGSYWTLAAVFALILLNGFVLQSLVMCGIAFALSMFGLVGSLARMVEHGKE